MELCSILSDINAPNATYKKIITWAQKIKTGDLLSPISRKVLLKRLAKSEGMIGNVPQSTVIRLPSLNWIKVTKFSVASQIVALLTDENLMHPSNLINDGKIEEFAEPKNFVDDIETGQWYIKTQKKLCKSQRDILCPIGLFIDKTPVNKSNALEPIMMTLGKLSSRTEFCVLRAVVCME